MKNHQLETQIEKYIADVRNSSEMPPSHKVSTSSEENLDTSDENELSIDFIRESERNKATMLQVPGKQDNILSIDNDYQMIDAHIDEGMRKCILNFEYVDLSKLLP